MSDQANPDPLTAAIADAVTRAAVLFQQTLGPGEEDIIRHEWRMLFADMTPEQFKAAFGAVLGRCEYFPRPHHIRSAHDELTRARPQRWDPPVRALPAGYRARKDHARRPREIRELLRGERKDLPDWLHAARERSGDAA